jgi:histidinol dehydrogenase
MERKDIITTSLQNRAAMIHVEDMDTAIEVANFIAAEHLELSVDEPMEMAKKNPPCRCYLLGSLYA